MLFMMHVHMFGAQFICNMFCISCMMMKLLNSSGIYKYVMVIFEIMCVYGPTSMIRARSCETIVSRLMRLRLGRRPIMVTSEA